MMFTNGSMICLARATPLFHASSTFGHISRSHGTAVSAVHLPRPSWKFANLTLSLSSQVACAAALPPNSLRTSPSTIFWADNLSPKNNAHWIWSFCCCVNVTPARVSAVMPFAGSLSALPSRTAADLPSVFIAAARSWVSPTAWS